MALSESSSSLWQLVIRRPLWLVLLLTLPVQALRGILLCWFVNEALKGLPLAGVLLCCPACQVLEGPASLLFRCPVLVCREIGCGDGSTPYA